MVTVRKMDQEIPKESGTHRVYEEIVNTIMRQIESGTLKPGSRLPAERQLAEQFQASRTAVREAIRTLASRGYVESRVGYGTVVREVTLDNVLQPFTSLLSRDRKMIRDILDVRIILETESAFRAAQHASVKDIELLEEAVAAMKKDVDKGEIGLEYDSLFHHRLADASGNEALLQILTMCSDLLLKSTRNSLSRPGTPLKSVYDHRRILEAVKQKDPAAAAKAMKDHLEQGYSLLGS